MYLHGGKLQVLGFDNKLLNKYSISLKTAKKTKIYLTFPQKPKYVIPSYFFMALYNTW